MKFIKLKIYSKVLFLLSLLCLSSFIESKNLIDLSLSTFKKNSKNTLNSIKKGKFSSKTDKNLYENSSLATKKSRSTFKRMMRYGAKWEFFNKLTEFFHGLKEKYTGPDKDEKPEISKMNNYDLVKLQAENFILKIIWEQTLSKVNDFENIVQKVSFTVNNPITALLFKVQDTVFNQDPNLKYFEEEKKENPVVKKKENTDEEKKAEEEPEKKEDNEKSKFKKFLDYARVKVVDLIEKTAINAVENLVENQFEGIYIGFFKTMLVEFSPISMINIQDSVVLGNIQDQVTKAFSGNSVNKSEEQLTKTVNDFINSTVDACKTHSNIKDISLNLIQKIVKFLSKNFLWFNKLIEKLNALIMKAKGIKEEEVKLKSILTKSKARKSDKFKTKPPKSILKGSSGKESRKKEVTIREDLNEVKVLELNEDITLWSHIRIMAYEIWKLIKDEFLKFFDTMKQCVSIYDENFLKFLPRAKLTFSVSIVGGIIDGLIKHTPGVSQLIGLVNSIIGIYTTWRIYTFGEIDLSIKDEREVDESQLGTKIAKFIASHIRGALGLLNIPGIENALKIVHGVYLLIFDSWKKTGISNEFTYTKVKDFFLNLTGISITKNSFDSLYATLKKTIFGKKLRRYYK